MSRRPIRRVRAAAVAALVASALAGCAADDPGTPATSPVAAASPLATAPVAASGAEAAKAAKNAKKAARTPRVLTTSGPGADDEPAAMALPGPPVRPVPPVGTRRPPTLPPPEGRRDNCAPLFGPGTTVALEADTTGGLVVSWRHNADPATLNYRVGVQPVEWVRGQGETRLTRPEIVWADVAPPPGCEPASYRVPGARRGVEYRIWLEVDVSTAAGDPARMSIGRLTGVTAG